MASAELGNTEREWEGQTEKVTVPYVQYLCVKSGILYFATWRLYYKVLSTSWERLVEFCTSQ